MARPLRIEYPGAWYHVMNRGRRKEKIFFMENDYKLFLKVLEECVRLYNVEIHAYSLLPNHYHLLIHTLNANLSRAMRHLNGVFTQKINKRYKYEGSLFRGRYKAIVVEEESYFLELIRYIHRNPLKAKLVEKIIDHRWTSHRGYMIEGESPWWLKVDLGLSKFDRYEKSAKRKFDAFVQEEVAKEMEDVLDRMRWPIMFGGEEFKEKITGLIKGKKLDVREMPQHKEARENITAVALADLLVNKLKLWEKGVFERTKKRSMVEKRRKFVYICREYLQISCKDICNALGGITFAAVSIYYKQSSDMMRDDKGFKGEIEDLIGVIRQNLNFKT